MLQLISSIDTSGMSIADIMYVSEKEDIIINISKKEKK